MQLPRAFSTITSTPSTIPRSLASRGLISTYGVPSFASSAGWLAMLVVTKWCAAPEIKTRGERREARGESGVPDA
jgi:hypothetical protein